MPTPHSANEGTDAVLNPVAPHERLMPVDPLVPTARMQLQHSVNNNESNNDSNLRVIDNHIISLPEQRSVLIKGRISNSTFPLNILSCHTLPYTDLRPDVCKFSNRGCLCRTWGLKDVEVREKFSRVTWYNSTDPAVFAVPIDKYKNGIELADTKLVLCSNTECTRLNDEAVVVPTCFHFCCYVNMIRKSSIDHLILCEEDEDFTDSQSEEMASMKDLLQNNEVILPVCGKKCYNNILRKRIARKKRLEHEAENRNRKETDTVAPHIRWDNDARNGSLTSEGLIVEWLTDESNAEKYFGGKHGHNNTVNGIRKDSYHVYLSSKIKETTGKFKSLYFYLCVLIRVLTFINFSIDIGVTRGPVLVKNKIEHLIRSYKNANEIVLSSGEGLEDDEYESFMDMIHKRHCKWYYALDSVLGSRHNVQAAYTNENNHNDETTSLSRSNNRLSSDQLVESDDDDEDSSEPCSSSSNTTRTSRLSHTMRRGCAPSIATNNNENRNDTSEKRSNIESPTKKTKVSSPGKLSYLEASSLRRRQKKSIADTRNKSASSEFAARTSEHFDRMYNIHQEKMAKQDELRKATIDIEHRKLQLESEKMKRDDILLQLKEKKLKGELMKQVTHYNFDIMKKRKEMKELYPEMTNEEMERILPLRNVE